MNENTKNAIKWANNYIDFFINNCDFDPFQVITGKMDKQHALYSECITLITAIETAAETFEKNRDKIAL